MQLGTKLRKLREEKRLSQKEVAERLQVSPSTYNSWESDQTQPKPTALVQLAELFETDITELLPTNTKVQIINAETINNEHNNKTVGFVENYTESTGLRDKMIQQMEAQLQDKERIIQMQNELISRLQEELKSLRQ